jgi:hypothetical protein
VRDSLGGSVNPSLFFFPLLLFSLQFKKKSHTRRGTKKRLKTRNNDESKKKGRERKGEDKRECERRDLYVR